MNYVTKVALIVKGDRVERGTEIVLSADEAKAFGEDIELAAGPAPEPEPEVERPLDDLSFAELKEKAKAMGLSASGSAADIRERIALNEGALAEGNEGEEGELEADNENDHA